MWKIKNKGFTLIELLITTSILGMIAVAIFSAFASGLSVYGRVQTYGGVQSDVLLSLEKMERNLRSMFNISGIDFVGDTKKVAFAGLIKRLNAEGKQDVSVGKISYYFNNETGALVEEEQNYPKAISGIETGESNSKILAFVENVNFSYYYFNSGIQAYSWKNSWSKGEGIPEGVKIEVIFKDGKKDVKLDRTVLIPLAG